MGEYIQRKLLSNQMGSCSDKSRDADLHKGGVTVNKTMHTETHMTKEGIGGAEIDVTIKKDEYDVNGHHVTKIVETDTVHEGKHYAGGDFRSGIDHTYTTGHIGGVVTHEHDVVVDKALHKHHHHTHGQAHHHMHGHVDKVYDVDVTKVGGHVVDVDVHKRGGADVHVIGGGHHVSGGHIDVHRDVVITGGSAGTYAPGHHGHVDVDIKRVEVHGGHSSNLGLGTTQIMENDAHAKSMALYGTSDSTINAVHKVDDIKLGAVGVHTDVVRDVTISSSELHGKHGFNSDHHISGGHAGGVHVTKSVDVEVIRR